MNQANSKQVNFRDIIDGLKTESTVKLDEPYKKGEKIKVHEVDEQMMKTGNSKVIVIDSCIPKGDHINGVPSVFTVNHHNEKITS